MVSLGVSVLCNRLTASKRFMYGTGASFLSRLGWEALASRRYVLPATCSLSQGTRRQPRIGTGIAGRRFAAGVDEHETSRDNQNKVQSPKRKRCELKPLYCSKRPREGERERKRGALYSSRLLQALADAQYRGDHAVSKTLPCPMPSLSLFVAASALRTAVSGLNLICTNISLHIRPATQTWSHDTRHVCCLEQGSFSTFSSFTPQHVKT
jgi:hypothetical protein